MVVVFLLTRNWFVTIIISVLFIGLFNGRCHASYVDIKVKECIGPGQGSVNYDNFDKIQQYVFEDNDVLYIEGSGFDKLHPKRTLVHLSGDAIQNSDFSLHINSSHLVLSLFPSKRWIRHIPNGPFQPLYLESIVTFDEESQTKVPLENRSIVIAFIAKRLIIHPNYQVINSSDVLIIAGQNLIGLTQIEFQFGNGNGPVASEISYTIGSELPLVDNSVMLKLDSNARWRAQSGPLQLLSYRISGFNSWNVLNQDVGLTVAIVQCGLFDSNIVGSITAHNDEEDMSMYDDQLLLTFDDQNGSIRPPLYFSNNIQQGVQYTISSIADGKVVLKLKPGQSWVGSSSVKFPFALKLISCKNPRIDSELALGPDGTGILVAMVYERPIVYESKSGILLQSKSSVLYIHGSGFYGTSVMLAFQPAIRQESMSIYVVTPNMLEVVLLNGARWMGESENGVAGAGYIRLIGISTRGDSGWTKVTDTLGSRVKSLASLRGAQAPPGVIVGIVQRGEVMNKHLSSVAWIISDNAHKASSSTSSSSVDRVALPGTDPFDWSVVLSAPFFPMCSFYDLTVIGGNSREKLVVACLSDTDTSVSGVYMVSISKLTAGRKSEIKANWKKILSLSIGLLDEASAAMKLKSSGSGSVLALVLANNLYLSFSHGVRWIKPFEQFVENYVFTDISTSPSGHVIALVAMKSSPLGNKIGGELFLSVDFGESWRRVNSQRDFQLHSHRKSDRENMMQSRKVYSVAIDGEVGTFILVSLDNGYFARSSTAGASWSLVQVQLEEHSTYIKCVQLSISVHRFQTVSNANLLLQTYSISAICLDHLGQIWISDNFGVGWVAGGTLHSVIDGIQEPVKWSSIAADKSGRIVIAKSIVDGTIPSSHIYLSVDAGKSFTAVKHPNLAVTALFAVSNLGNIVVAAAVSKLTIGTILDESLEDTVEVFDDDSRIAGSVTNSSRIPPGRSVSSDHSALVVTPPIIAGAFGLFGGDTKVNVFSGNMFSDTSHERYVYRSPLLLSLVPTVHTWKVTQSGPVCGPHGHHSIAITEEFMICANNSGLITYFGLTGYERKNYALMLPDANAATNLEEILSTFVLISPTVWLSCMRLSDAKITEGCSLYRSTDKGGSWAFVHALTQHYIAGRLSTSGKYQAVTIGKEAARNAWRDNGKTFISNEIVAGFEGDIPRIVLGHSIDFVDISHYESQFTAQDRLLWRQEQQRTHQWNVKSAYQLSIALSDDFGETWTTQHLTFADWNRAFIYRQIYDSSVAVSDIGSWVYVSIPLYGIITTTNFGKDGWLKTTALALNWRDIATTDNGQHVVAAYAPFRQSGQHHASGGVYYSHDFGQTWTRAQTVNSWIERVSISRLGAIMHCVAIACKHVDCSSYLSDDYFQQVYASSDFGQNWVQLSAPDHLVSRAGSLSLAVSPGGDSLAVVDADGSVVTGLNKRLSVASGVFHMYPFHFSFFTPSPENFETKRYFVSGVNLAGEVTGVFEPSLTKCGLNATFAILSSYSIELVISRLEPFDLPFCSGNFVLISMTVISPSGNALAMMLEPNPLHMLSIYPRPTVFSGYIALFETSVRSIRVMGKGFQGPLCFVYLQPTAVGTYQCKIISSFELEISLFDDDGGYSGSWGWLDMLHQWDENVASIPLRMVGIYLGSEYANIDVEIAKIFRDPVAGVSSLAPTSQWLPWSWYSIMFQQQGLSFMTQFGVGKLRLPVLKGANISTLLTHFIHQNIDCNTFAVSSDGNLVYLVCGNSIFRSYNSGRQFAQVYSGNNTWSAIACSANGKYSVVASSSSMILRYSTSFGSSWLEAEIILPTEIGLLTHYPMFQSLRMAEDGLTAVVVLVTEKNDTDGIRSNFAQRPGLVLISRSNGKSWQAVVHNNESFLSAIVFCSGLCVSMTSIRSSSGGASVIHVSKDFGLTWQLLSFLGLAAVHDIALRGNFVVVSGRDFVNEPAVLASYSGGKLWSKFDYIGLEPLDISKIMVSSTNQTNLIMIGWQIQAPTSPVLLTGSIHGSPYLRIMGP